MTPIISVITGTYNRRASLARFVGSARRNIPMGIPYEIILVDGGSTDGTQDWCHSQPDVTLIEQGELKGAISAFCAGADAATGEYVLLGNDDVELADGSLMTALTYLDMHPQCGAVAFADNRPAPGYGSGYKVQTFQVRHGEATVNQPYAQVGLFRRALGARAGWWGRDDPQFAGHTYGGDNYLSARLYEMGYTVDAVSACRITDHLESDDLRVRNEAIEAQHPGAYYERFPTPPVFGSDIPMVTTAAFDEHLRVLYFPLYEPGYGHYKIGLTQALQRAGYVWEVDYQNDPYDLPAIAAIFQPHILLMQCHSPHDVPLATLTAARAEQPGMLVVNWNGDVYEQNLTGDKMLAFLKHVDLQLTVNADTLPVYAAHDIPATYWQVGFEPVDYQHLPRMQSHDVVFLANCYSDTRKQLGGALRSMKGIDVGLYGRSWQWGNGDTTYQFAPSAALCQNAKICIGDNQYGQRGFVSNRIFETLAAGGFLLHQVVPGLEDLTGLQDGVHYVSWTDLNDLQGKIRYWLKTSQQDQRQQIAAAGRAFAQARHSFDARVKQLLTEIIPSLEPIPA